MGSALPRSLQLKRNKEVNTFRRGGVSEKRSLQAVNSKANSGPNKGSADGCGDD